MPWDAFGFLANRGPSLFDKQNLKMAVLQVKKCQNGMKRDRSDPWLYKKVPCDPFGFASTIGPSLFSN